MKNKIKQVANAPPIDESIVEMVNNLPKKDDPKKTKVYNWSTIVYPDSTDYKCSSLIKSIEKFCDDNDYMYAYILHNNDKYTSKAFDNNYHLVGEIGEIKKPHYHLLVCMSSYKYICDLSNMFNIKQNLIKKCNNVQGMICYLIHKFENGKQPYNENLIITNRKEYVYDTLNNYRQSGSINYLYYYIDNTIHPTFKEFISYCILNNVNVGDVRRNYPFIRDIINECKQSEIFRNNINSNLEKERIKILNENSHLVKLADTFDRVDVNDNGEIKTLMCINKKNGKNK